MLPSPPNRLLFSMPSPLPQHGSQQRTSHHRQRDPQTVMGKVRRTEHRQTHQARSTHKPLPPAAAKPARCRCAPAPPPARPEMRPAPNRHNPRSHAPHWQDALHRQQRPDHIRRNAGKKQRHQPQPVPPAPRQFPCGHKNTSPESLLLQAYSGEGALFAFIPRSYPRWSPRPSPLPQVTLGLLGRALGSGHLLIQRTHRTRWRT